MSLPEAKARRHYCYAKQLCKQKPSFCLALLFVCKARRALHKSPLCFGTKQRAGLLIKQACRLAYLGSPPCCKQELGLSYKQGASSWRLLGGSKPPT